jgi:hypothetical protein
MQLYEYMKFQVFTASSAFWDIAPCSLVEVDQRFRGAYCLYNQGDYRNVGLLRDYTPLYSIRLSSLCEYVLSIISALWQFGVFRIGLFYAFMWHINIRTTAHYQALNPCSFNKWVFFFFFSSTGAYGPGLTFGLPFQGFLITHTDTR